MTKQVLLLQLRSEDELSNEELASIVAAGLQAERIHRVRMDRGDLPNIRLDDYAAVILGGGPSCVSYPDSKKFDYQKHFEPWLFALVQEVIDRDMPFLGMCYGVGVVSHVLGATVSSTYGEEVGAIKIGLTTEGRMDPLLADMPTEFEAFVGHKEAADALPGGAVLLASSSTCPVQLYRVGKNVYVSQFHPELDFDQFALRVAAYKHLGYFSPDAVHDIIAEAKTHDTSEATQILKNFIGLYCKPA